jgi:PHP family Zn ribbon phosphoesterase
LTEIIAESLGCGVNTKKVNAAYEGMLRDLGPELPILRDASPGDLARAGSPLIAEAVTRMRGGRVTIAPGYDGEYGKIRIFGDGERAGCLASA